MIEPRVLDGACDCSCATAASNPTPHRLRPSSRRVIPVNRFILKMAWRETRGAWRHFLYFFACIAIGVGALVGVSLFGTNMERAVTKEARGLLGGDLEIRLTHPLSLAGQTVLDSLNDTRHGLHPCERTRGHGRTRDSRVRCDPIDADHRTQSGRIGISPVRGDSTGTGAIAGCPAPPR